MTTATQIKKLNKEVQTLREDLARVKRVLAKTTTIPEESIRSYKNAATVKRARHFNDIQEARAEIEKRKTVSQKRLFKSLGL